MDHLPIWTWEPSSVPGYAQPHDVRQSGRMYDVWTATVKGKRSWARKSSALVADGEGEDGLSPNVNRLARTISWKDSPRVMRRLRRAMRSALADATPVRSFTSRRPIVGGARRPAADTSRAAEGFAGEDAPDGVHVALRHPERVSNVAGVVLIQVADLGMSERRLTALAQADVELRHEQRIANIHHSVAVHVTADAGVRRGGCRARAGRGGDRARGRRARGGDPARAGRARRRRAGRRGRGGLDRRGRSCGWRPHRRGGGCGRARGRTARGGRERPVRLVRTDVTDLAAVPVPVQWPQDTALIIPGWRAIGATRIDRRAASEQGLAVRGTTVRPQRREMCVHLVDPIARPREAAGIPRVEVVPTRRQGTKAGAVVAGETVGDVHVFERRIAEIVVIATDRSVTLDGIVADRDGGQRRRDVGRDSSS